MQLLPQVIISPLHNKQDSGLIDVVREHFLSIKRHFRLGIYI